MILILIQIVSIVYVPNQRSAVIYLVSLIITQLSIEYSLTLPLSCTLSGAAARLPLHCHKVTIATQSSVLKRQPRTVANLCRTSLNYQLIVSFIQE